MDLSAYRVTGVNNPGRQVSVDRWNGLLDTLEIHGAPLDFRAYGGNPDGAVDNYALFMQAVAEVGSGGAIYIPAGRYYFSQRIALTNGIHIFGDGCHQNPGIAGGVSYSGVNRFDGTILVCAPDVGGMIFYANSDNDNAAAADADITANGTASVEYKYKSASGSSVRDLMLYGGGGTTVAPHGIEARCLVFLDGVRCDYFAGNGFLIEASTHTLTTPYGNANGSRISRCKAVLNKLHGFRDHGYDANAMVYVDCNAQLNGGAGFHADSMLGNTYVGCQSSTNNQSYGAATVWTTKCQADAPILATASDVGSYVSTGTVSANAFIGCYAEPGGGMKGHIMSPSTVIGGQLSSLNGLTSTSTGVQVGAVTYFNGESNGTGVRAMTGTCYLTLNPVSGTYSNLKLYGNNGSTALGLDIVAGGGGASLSADSFTFRNAAQAATYFTANGAGINLASGMTVKVNGTQVVTSRQTGTAANATDLATAITLVNDLKARLVTHGLIS